MGELSGLRNTPGKCPGRNVGIPMQDYKFVRVAVMICASERAGTGTGTVSARSRVASVRPRNIFWTGLGPCAAFAHDM